MDKTKRQQKVPVTLYRHCDLAGTWSTGLIAFRAVVTLWGYLLLYFWNR
jgi:hypothetical protein